MGKCEYIDCDKELSGRQKRFCSEEHRVKHYKLINRPKYLEYYKNYYQHNRKNKYCVICGKELPKHKKKYCSPGCNMRAYTKCDNYDPNRYAVLPCDPPDKCDECGSKVIHDGFDYVCSKCGLVML